MQDNRRSNYITWHLNHFLFKTFSDKHDIIIDKVAASHDNSHIVAVTSNNMVCIWKRCSTDNTEHGPDSQAE